MKKPIDKRKPSGFLDYASLAITTFGVGYIPGAPGTYGSAVAVAFYVLISWMHENSAFMHSIAGGSPAYLSAFSWAINGILLAIFAIIGIAASDRACSLLGDEDASEAVVDEVMGQLVTFAFIPFVLSWQLILAGFLLFRIFDIWKPYPINDLQALKGGLGICADDLVAGVYAGLVLAVIYVIFAFV